MSTLMKTGWKRMRRATMWLTVTTLAVSLAACGSNQLVQPGATPSATPTVVVSAPTPTATAPALTAQRATLLFSDDATDGAHNPFPSDRLLDDTGHVQLPVSYLDPGLPSTASYERARGYLTRTAGQFSAFTGFSTFAPIRIRFDQPVVVEAGTNPRGILLLRYDDLAAPPVPIRASVYAPQNAIEVQPVRPLQPKTTYAVVVTTALSNVAGLPIQPSPDFATLLASSDLSPALAAWRARLQPVIDFVEQTYGLAPTDLALVNLFTTAPTTDDLIAIQQRLVSGNLVPGPPVFQNSPVPNLDTGIFPPGTTEFDDLVHGATNVSAVAIGSFDSYDFRVRPNGAFDPNLVYGTAVPPVNHLAFYVTIPAAPPPPGGYPVVIFGHGLGGSGRDVGSVVPQVVGDAPIMGIAISALQHGDRGNPTNFFDLSNITTTREYFRQTVADFMQLERMVKNAQQAGIAPFDQVDPHHIMYFGISLGGIMGTIYMGVEPDVHVGVLSVPGGGLPNILDSHDIGALLEPLVSLTVGIAQDDPFFPRFIHGFKNLVQWALDAADPINYAPYMIVPGLQLPGVPAKHILMHEGIVDNTVPNRTTDDLALAMWLPDLNATRGCMDPDGCSGIWRFVMTDYGEGELSGHGVSTLIPQARMQVAEFLNSFGTVVTDASPQ